MIVGDCDLDEPLRVKLAPLFAANIRVRWIPGNHDTDEPRFHDNLWGSQPGGNIHASYALLGGRVIGGLGGIFNEKVWYPRFEAHEPRFASRRAYLKAVRREDRWLGSLPLAARAAIFPEDIEALTKLRVDVLVTHEAPTSHKHGFSGIDTAADRCRAKLVIHGHHHVRYEGHTRSGIPVIGLRKAEVFRLPDKLPARRLDGGLHAWRPENDA